jgi:hypothetical protein
MRTFTNRLGCVAGLSVLLIPVVTGSQGSVVQDDGLDVDSHLTCPAEGVAGSTISVDLRLENFECRAVNVRVMSSILGNGDQTLAGLRVFGPVVAHALEVVPAATDIFFGGCVQGMCQAFPPTSCTTDADCPDCTGTTPGVREISISAPPALPADLKGTVGTHLILTEWEAGATTETEINQCFVEVL